jgi:glycosyltransferase involved in cell wall biosynthesis
MPRFSIIIPVYNRPDEIDDLLKSLASQTMTDFEVVITEDGSSVPCRDVVERYADCLDIKYFYKENEGRSIARNNSMEHATGDYFVFFDSDCVIPADYFATLSRQLDENPVDCFGGPDAAHESFTTTQRAINFAMTSFLTTGGIRGGKVSMEKFTPRTFNMGFSRSVYQTVGGFREMFSEDIDMSKRIEQAGFSTRLIRSAAVYHKRRVDFAKFFRQVYVFGMSRITLKMLYPGSLKLVHTLPALAIVALLALIVAAIVVDWRFVLPIAAYLVAIFVGALISSRSLVVAVKAVPASVIQIGGYGLGFIKAFVSKIVMGRGRDIDSEIAIRKGK